ncbi:AAA family ATPase [Helicobacter suis]|uniref:AAA family ATPase n=1 Tax=Helicobacter suis TaxID=104628 RepID=UPI001F078B5D|nr:AAA family ATPase [Helicobacter suis]
MREKLKEKFKENPEKVKEDIAKAKIEYELQYKEAKKREAEKEAERKREKAEKAEYRAKHEHESSVYHFLIDREFLRGNFYIAEALWVLALERLLAIFNPLGMLEQTEFFEPEGGYADDDDFYYEPDEFADNSPTLFVKKKVHKIGLVEEYLLTRLSHAEKIIFERAFNQHEESLCMTALLSLLSHMDFPVAVSREHTEYEIETGGETKHLKREGRLVFARNPHFKPNVFLNESAHDLGSLYALFTFVNSIYAKEAIIKIMEYSNSQDNISAYAAPLIVPLAPFITPLSPLQAEKSTNGEYSEQQIRQEDAKERMDFTEESTKPQDKYSPKAIKRYLDHYVIGQEKAKKQMSLVFRDHYKRINGQSNLPKANALCIGPSGSGKTFLIEKAAEYLDIPYCIFNAASLSPSGYKGAYVSEIFFNLYTKANCDIEKTQKGVVVLDEIDKLGQGTDDVLKFRQSVQEELLKVVEKNEICFEYGTGKGKETISLKTNNILFVALGHFEKLWRGNAKVQQTHSIGFISNKPLLDPQLRPAPKSSPF